MFCSMFSRSSPCLLGQHDSCSSAKLPVELSNVTKSFPYPAAPLCRVVPRFIMIICKNFCYNSNLGSCLHWKILVGGAISSRQTEQSKSLSKMDERSGGNCVKISLPGKLILIKRTHCCRRGPRLDLSFQRKFQQNMKILCWGFHKMHK